MWFECPYLGRDVELTAERRSHIETRHPRLLPSNEHRLAETLRDPDFVGDRDGPAELAFVRLWPDLMGGKSVVAVVISRPVPEASVMRYWIVTAYVSRNTRSWRPLWTRS